MRVKTYPVVPYSQSPGKMQKRPFMLRAAREEWQHSIHKELKMAWIALKALGLLPLLVNQTQASGGRRIFSYALQAAYAAGFYLAFGYYALYRMQAISSMYLDTENKLQIVLALLSSKLSVTHVVLGPLLWVRMPHVLHFLKDWDAFQESFHRVTHHPLRLGMFWVSSITIVLTVAGSIGGILTLAYLSYGGDFVGSIFYIYGAIQINVLLTVWFLLCLASARAGDQLALRLKEDVVKTGVHSRNLLNEYQSTWLRLSQLTSDIGDVFCHVFNVIVLFCLLELLLAAFQGAKLFVNNCPKNLYIGVVGLAINSFIAMNVFCSAANYATDTVSKKFVKFLVEIPVEKDVLKKQLHDLAQAVATHGAVINLGGFYVVDRSLIVSIMSVFATFMVVLIQSAPDSDVQC